MYYHLMRKKVVVGLLTFEEVSGEHQRRKQRIRLAVLLVKWDRKDPGLAPSGISEGATENKRQKLLLYRFSAGFLSNLN
jgi:hypothetical protein